jgi:hypothetical protein
MEDRRITAGRLDCPMCETRYPIRDGVVRLDEAKGGTGAPATREGAPDAARSRSSVPVLPAEAAALAAALLGAPEGPETLLLAGAAAGLGPEVAELRPEAVIVAWGPAPQTRHLRVHPAVPSGATPVPRLRPAGLAGAVLAGAAGRWASAIAPAIGAGGRLVVLAPGSGFDPPADAGLEELASDARAWVGARR